MGEGVWEQAVLAILTGRAGGGVGRTRKISPMVRMLWFVGTWS